MKFSRVFFCLMALTVFSAGLCQGKAADEEEKERKGEILVVYPEEAVNRRGKDNLSAIAQVLFSMRYRVDWVEAAYAAEEIGYYEKVIWCATASSELMDPGVLDGYDGYLMVLGQAAGMGHFGISPIAGLEGRQIGTTEYQFDDRYAFKASVEFFNPGAYVDPAYSNGAVDVLAYKFPLVSGAGQIRYIPLIDYTTDFAKTVLMQEIAQWLWVWDSPLHTYSEHVVFSPVYPFTDPYRLKEFVDYMVDLKMNFVISVMPIYEHADYPAMRRFCEVLRYAQANGGAVILHAPIIQTNIDPDELESKITIAANNYFENGVWLLGLEIPSEWIFDQELTAQLGWSRTLFFTELDGFESRSVSEYDFNAYLDHGSQQVVPALHLDETGISHIARCSTAVYVDISITKDDVVYSVIDAVKDSPIPIQSLWYMEQALYLTDFKHLTWDRNTLIVNGTQRFNIFEPVEIEENYNYKRNVYYRFVTNLANQNRFLMAISSGVLVLFVFLVFQSRKQMHRRFLKKVPKEIEEKEA